MQYFNAFEQRRASARHVVNNQNSALFIKRLRMISGKRALQIPKPFFPRKFHLRISVFMAFQKIRAWGAPFARKLDAENFALVKPAAALSVPMERHRTQQSIWHRAFLRRYFRKNFSDTPRIFIFETMDEFCQRRMFFKPRCGKYEIAEFLLPRNCIKTRIA